MRSEDEIRDMIQQSENAVMSKLSMEENTVLTVLKRIYMDGALLANERLQTLRWIIGDIDQI